MANPRRHAAARPGGVLDTGPIGDQPIRFTSTRSSAPPNGLAHEHAELAWTSDPRAMPAWPASLAASLHGPAGRMPYKSKDLSFHDHLPRFVSLLVRRAKPVTLPLGVAAGLVICCASRRGPHIRSASRATERLAPVPAGTIVERFPRFLPAVATADAAREPPFQQKCSKRR